MVCLPFECGCRLLALGLKPFTIIRISVSAIATLKSAFFDRIDIPQGKRKVLRGGQCSYANVSSTGDPPFLRFVTLIIRVADHETFIFNQH